MTTEKCPGVEQLAPLTLDLKVQDSNPTIGKVQLVTMQCFIAQRHSLSLLGHLDMTQVRDVKQ